MANFIDNLIDYVGSTQPADIGQVSFERAARSLVDTLGVMLAGSRSQIGTPLLTYAAGTPGAAPIIGGGRRSAPDVAALLNGAFGHAFDFDDGFPGYPIHSSNVITACLVSAASVQNISGEEFLKAFVIGTEVEIAIGRRIGIRHYERGFHATSTLGVFGGIAAIAALHGSDAVTLRSAFGIGASLAGGLQRNFGTMVKPLHAGFAARNAIVAHDLASGGIRSHEDAFAGVDGFLAAFGDVDDPTAMKEQPRFDALEMTGLGLKKFPCVNACHRPIDGLLQLRAEHGLTAESVARIVCLVPPGSLRPIKYREPTTPHEAKFSMHYILAAALLDSRVDLGTFTDAAIAREDITLMLRRIETREDPTCAGPIADTRGPGTRGHVLIRAELHDGAIVERRVDYAPGNPKREMTTGDLQEKFLGCARFSGMEERAASQLGRQVLTFATIANLGRFFEELMCAGSSGTARNIPVAEQGAESDQSIKGTTECLST